MWPVLGDKKTHGLQAMGHGVAICVQFHKASGAA
jgi:hypothetical protein